VSNLGQFAQNHPKSKCKTCGKDIIVRSTRGKDAEGYCSRPCWSMKRYEKRYVGARSGQFDRPTDIMDKTKNL